MGILDMLMGNGIDQRTIASDLQKDSKFSVIALAVALTNTTDHQLRLLVENHLLTSIQQHHQLSDLLQKKDWYQSYLAPQEQIREELRWSENVIQ